MLTLKLKAVSPDGLRIYKYGPSITIKIYPDYRKLGKHYWFARFKQKTLISAYLTPQQLKDNSFIEKQILDSLKTYIEYLTKAINRIDTTRNELDTILCESS